MKKTTKQTLITFMLATAATQAGQGMPQSSDMEAMNGAGNMSERSEKMQKKEKQGNCQGQGKQHRHRHRYGKGKGKGGNR